MKSRKDTYVIASDRPWNRRLADDLNQCDLGQFVLIEHKEALTPEHLDSISPRYIFLPHWSFFIPPSIYERFECVIFHMTDVPYGRGGSPLQNLIVRGHTDTVMSALRCVEEIDAGPVYLKQPLSLYGEAEEIYLRASKVIRDMIIKIIEDKPLPVDQNGEIVWFERRQPEDSNLKQAHTVEEAFDLIRMLDAEGYPSPFVEIGDFRMEFRRASLRTDGIHADVIIKKREKDGI